jgi:hypothetical protein
MNFKILMVALLFSIGLTSCGPTIYKADNFEANRYKVKTLAIIPFTINIDTKRLPKNVTIESVRQSEEKTGFSMQNSVYSWFLKRHKDYTTEFQDIDKTNALLKRNNITYEDLIVTDKAELCKLLGVDGIVSGKATMSKPMSEGGAVALGLLVGVWGATNKTDVSITIHDKTANLQWKYDYQASGSIGSSTESLTNALMRNASKRFPYKTN